MATRLKTCSRCRVEKPVAEFFSRSGRGDGLAAYSGRCKPCELEVRRVRDEQDPSMRKRHERAYRERHRNEIYERNRVWRTKKRADLIAFLGGECSRCGFTDIRALQVDHINGGGSLQRQNDPAVNSVNGLFKAVQANPSDYTVLCANCNWIKRTENEEYGNRWGDDLSLRA